MRTVIVYHKDGSKSEYSDARSNTRGRDERDDKVAFHRGVLETFRQAEEAGKLHCSRREADFHKRVHTAAIECGGDLPPRGATRLPF